MLRLLLVCASTVALAASAAMAQDAKTATATFISKAGKESGTAKLTGTDKGVLIELDVNGLPAGQWVAFHVHETGSCDHAGGHMSAGGHFNPGKAAHGFNDAKGPHAGDMPNQYVSDPSGTPASSATLRCVTAAMPDRPMTASVARRIRSRRSSPRACWGTRDSGTLRQG